MRRALEKLEGERLEFIGKFSRLGKKPGWDGAAVTTILLEDIVVADSGQHVASHLWFNYTKGFAAVVMAGLKSGERVRFWARVDPYAKGYQGRRDDVCKPVAVDYNLSRPTKVVRMVTE